MIDRRALIRALSAAVVAAPLRPLRVYSQQVGKVSRIGVLDAGSPPHPFGEAFRRGLAELGYTESQNIAMDYRWAENKFERLATLAAELVRIKVDVIVAGFSPAVSAARSATRTIPIVFIAVGDPVGVGFARSLAHPQGNLTGLTHMSVDLTARSCGLLKDLVPGLKRLAVLQNPASPIIPFKMKGIHEAARLLGLQVQLFDVHIPGDLESRFSAIRRERFDALFTLQDPVTFSGRKEIAALAAAIRLPSMYEASEYVDAGGLMSYGAQLADLWRRAATYVDRILKGAKPADLPIEQATKFELVINVKTAKTLGLMIPPSLLLQADRIIE